MFVALKVPGMPLHNNATETDIRGIVVLHRNIHHNFRTKKGMETFGILFSFMSSVKKMGIGVCHGIDAMVDDPHWDMYGNDGGPDAPKPSGPGGNAGDAPERPDGSQNANGTVPERPPQEQQPGQSAPPDDSQTENDAAPRTERPVRVLLGGPDDSQTENDAAPEWPPQEQQPGQSAPPDDSQTENGIAPERPPEPNMLSESGDTSASTPRGPTIP